MPNLRTLNLAGVMEVLKCSRSHVFRLMNRPDHAFPPGMQYSRHIVWREETVDRWIQAEERRARLNGVRHGKSRAKKATEGGGSVGVARSSTADDRADGQADHGGHLPDDRDEGAAETARVAG